MSTQSLVKSQVLQKLINKQDKAEKWTSLAGGGGEEQFKVLPFFVISFS